MRWRCDDAHAIARGRLPAWKTESGWRHTLFSWAISLLRTTDVFMHSPFTLNMNIHYGSWLKEDTMKESSRKIDVSQQQNENEMRSRHWLNYGFAKRQNMENACMAHIRRKQNARTRAISFIKVYRISYNGMHWHWPRRIYKNKQQATATQTKCVSRELNGFFCVVAFAAIILL